LVKGLFLGLLYWSASPDASIVDENIETTETFDGRSDDRLAHRHGPNGTRRLDDPASGTELGDGLARRFLCAAVDSDACTGFEERLDNCATDSSSAAGHENAFVGKIELHDVSLKVVDVTFDAKS
jgi:hypothetical protein